MNALIMALVVWLMMKEISFDGDYMVANITAYLIAQIHNFIWCKYWIFPVENKRRCVKMRTFFFLSTKPRLSQAGALLLPKDFVSLGIRFSL